MFTQGLTVSSSPLQAAQQSRPNTGARCLVSRQHTNRASLLTVRGQPTPEERRGDPAVEEAAINKDRYKQKASNVRVVGAGDEEQEEPSGFFGGAGDSLKDAIDNAGETLAGLGKDVKGNAEEAGDSASEVASDEGGGILEKLGLGEKADKGVMTTDGDN